MVVGSSSNYDKAGQLTCQLTTDKKFVKLPTSNVTYKIASKWWI